MKKLILLTVSLLTLLLFGCNKSDSGDSNPVGLSPNNSSGNVTFKISIEQDQQGTTYFHFVPNVDVKIVKVEATLNNQTYITNGDGTTVYNAKEGFSIEVNNPVTGDKWTFKIVGKLAGNDKDFTATVNYTIPAGFGGGNTTVTFEISSQPGQQGSTEFLFKPNVDVKITSVDVSMGGASDVINGDGTTIYPADNWHVLAGYTGVESGQQWTFTFEGKIAVNDKDYNVTVNYTIP